MNTLVTTFYTLNSLFHFNTFVASPSDDRNIWGNKELLLARSRLEKNGFFALGPGSTHVKETLASEEEKDGHTELQGSCKDKIAAKLGRKLLKPRVKPASGSSN